MRAKGIVAAAIAAAMAGGMALAMAGCSLGPFSRHPPLKTIPAEDVAAWEAKEAQALPLATKAYLYVHQEFCNFGPCTDDMVTVEVEFATYVDLTSSWGALADYVRDLRAAMPGTSVSAVAAFNDQEQIQAATGAAIVEASDGLLSGADLFFDPIGISDGQDVGEVPLAYATMRIFVDDPSELTPEVFVTIFNVADTAATAAGARVWRVLPAQASVVEYKAGIDYYDNGDFSIDELPAFAALPDGCLRSENVNFDVSGRAGIEVYRPGGGGGTCSL